MMLCHNLIIITQTWNNEQVRNFFTRGHWMMEISFCKLQQMKQITTSTKATSVKAKARRLCYRLNIVIKLYFKKYSNFLSRLKMVENHSLIQLISHQKWLQLQDTDRLLYASMACNCCYQSSVEHKNCYLTEWNVYGNYCKTLTVVYLLVREFDQ